MKPVARRQAKVHDTDSRKRPRDSAKPKAAPKPKSPAPEEPWYKLRDIIDEKVVSGRIHYLIDWEGTDKKGQPFAPTWEPAENVNDVAINAWRDTKRNAVEKATHAPGSNPASPQVVPTQVTSTQDSEPVQVPTWKRKRKHLHRERQSEDTTEESPSRTASDDEGVAGKRHRAAGDLRAQSAGPGLRLSSGLVQGQPVTNLQQTGHIVVELPRTGGFDPAEFLHISSSQSSSQRTTQQFTQQSTQQSTRHLWPEIRRAKSVPTRDERVIPDSQETVSIFARDPPASGESSSLQRISCSAPPSHQQDPVLVDTSVLVNLDISTNSLLNGAPNHNPSSPRTGSAGPSQGPIGSANPRFQSQLSYDWDNRIATSAKTPDSSIIPSSHQHEITSSASGPADSQHTHNISQAPTPRNSQAAQIVQPLNSYPSTTVSQGEQGEQEPGALDAGSLDDPVADPGKEQGDTQDSVQGPGEVDGDNGPFSAPHSSIGSPVIEPSQQSCPVTPRTMNKTPSEVVSELREKLKALRESKFGTPSRAVSDSLAGTPRPVDVEAAQNGEAQTEVGPESGLGSPAPFLPLTLPAPAPAPAPAADGAEQEHAQTAYPPEATQSHITPSSWHERLSSDVGPPPHVEQPATLDPASLSLSIENEVDGSPSVPTEDGITSLLHPRSPHMSEDEEEHPGYPEGLSPCGQTGASEYVVTLPFQTSIRPQYNDIIRDNESLMREYNACFQVFPHQTPRAGLVSKLDTMFSRLFDICDYPPFLDSLSSMSVEQVSKHAVGSNPKFAFVAEFIEQLQAVNSDKKVLVLARPGKLIDLLDHVIRARSSRYVRSGHEVVGAAEAESPLSITLCSTSDETSIIPKDSDVVIAFDHTFRPASIIPSGRGSSPVVLALVTTASIQHLNMHITQGVQTLERKNLLMLSLVRAMSLVEGAEPASSPTAIAEKFAARVQSPEDDDDEFYWEPSSLPADFFADLYASGSDAYSTQFTPVVENDQYAGGRKRSHIEDDGEPNRSKKPKLAQPQLVAPSVHISDRLRSLLGDDLHPGQQQGTAVVPLEKLEALAARIVQLESKLKDSKVRENEFRQLSDRAQREVDSYVMSVNKIQVVYMDALKDRGIFEAECEAAKLEAAALSGNLESSRAEVTSQKAARAALEKQLAEANNALLQSSNPDLVKMAELGRELSAAKTEVQRMEKRLVVLQSDTEYAKNMYNQASQRAAVLAAENRAQDKQVAELRRRADENIQKVQKIQAQQENRALALQVRDCRNLLNDREAELSRVKEELRVLKSGRRETRGSSVPHSPRLGSLGVMSPRNGNRGPSAMGGPSSSRGTSPAPLAGVYDGPAGAGAAVPNSSHYSPAAGAGRLSHLRDQRF
ncbi:hypothetical protein F5Y17DRAFT_415688 [Xylariaceae sp. FL0594]|nr:hypothetical protein F5Y17DRAFT_415688 [Xylariaceae sp. FL0594]